MPTPAERQALLFLAAVAVIGGGVRAAASRGFGRELARAEQGLAPPASMGARALEAQIAAVDSARAHRPSSRKKAGQSRGRGGQPTRTPASMAQPVPQPVHSPLPPVDVNSASAAELEQLPRVGPALAARIVAWRDTHGPFNDMNGLRHVRGIGPATARLLSPLVTFSGRHSPSQSEAPAVRTSAHRMNPGRKPKP
jgi:competence protein ComEA